MSFVYDVPYLSACGIFPPLHILNQCLLDGGGDAGMSPGVSWEPFQLNEEEYEGLWEALERIDPTQLEARFTSVKYKRDPELENETKFLSWTAKACAKHKEWFFDEQANNENE